MDTDLYESVKDIIDAMNDTKILLVHALAGNNRKARRARTALVELEKKGRVFRKLSVQHFKDARR